jgi:hypothetical protein
VKDGGKRGVSAATFRNPNKHCGSLINLFGASDLAFVDSFVGFRLFASVSGFARAMTLAMSLVPKGFPSFLVRELLERTRKLVTEPR